MAYIPQYILYFIIGLIQEVAGDEYCSFYELYSEDTFDYDTGLITTKYRRTLSGLYCPSICCEQGSDRYCCHKTGINYGGLVGAIIGISVLVITIFCCCGSYRRRQQSRQSTRNNQQNISVISSNSDTTGLHHSNGPSLHSAPPSYEGNTIVYSPKSLAPPSYEEVMSNNRYQSVTYSVTVRHEGRNDGGDTAGGGGDGDTRDDQGAGGTSQDSN